MAYERELTVAKEAVARACQLARAVSEGQTESITKADDSPVTVADFGAQGIIINALAKAFPSDKIVGEEDAARLREDAALRRRVFDLVREAQTQDQFEAARITTEEELCDAIDLGNYGGGGVGRMWALDPIDGTKGFIRRGQYAVCLALVVNGHVELGVIGCPNLPAADAKGALFSAVRGAGAFVEPLARSRDDERVAIRFNQLSRASDGSFCESVEAGHSAHATQALIAARLGITKPSVRMDSQAKYCSIARGDGDVYLRLPVSATYEEKIWDHAAGNVLVSEAGGVVTDMHGNPLDFTQGRTLKNNSGVIAASASIFDEVIAAVREVTSSPAK
ncbi:3'(2'),5'-bisphosphate nucleotidase [Trichomonascus vanleenenianus]|uniref:3'(2'),5'-bisphosphate nucleotidase n=1 Tax=Trichomonascus vanleenenianus TaxID=2268995 RepID=UPI003EC9F7DC